VRVADTGRGIATEEQARIFERFHRADPARGSAGTGLGLAIARWIVDEHGGAITLDSATGRGSVFTVWLPIIPVPYAPSEGADFVYRDFTRTSV